MKKYPLWLPYVSTINTKESCVKIIYKGGDINIDWSNIHSIMFYGSHPPLEQKFLEKCVYYQIPIVIHRRNMANAVWINSSFYQDKENILTKQIKFRLNKKKIVHISKKLVKAKLQSFSWLIKIDQTCLYKINKLEYIRAVEAWASKKYWKAFFANLKIVQTRREKTPITSALDAVSKFTASIVLRWILYHHLSPYHGFLHEPSDYPALVYDLLEPYRPYFDKCVYDACKKTLSYDMMNITPLAIENVKKLLLTKIYCHSTRQIATFHELLHGNVLALQSYLQKKSFRYIPPLPSYPNGGRPIKTGYKLYGRTAGITNFYSDAKTISDGFYCQLHAN